MLLCGLLDWATSVKIEFFPLLRRVSIVIEKKPHNEAHPELVALQAKSGLQLFAIYFVAYAIFMGLATFAPKIMATVTPLGPNVAIVYGFGLILGAIFIALAYMLLCKWNVDGMQQGKNS
jgi:uncharacterized membrane protein (DUF485 family)